MDYKTTASRQLWEIRQSVSSMEMSGYKVNGIKSHTSNANFWCLNNISDRHVLVWLKQTDVLRDIGQAEQLTAERLQGF